MTGLDVDDVILNYDPAAPHARFRDSPLRQAIVLPEAALPQAVPWPAGAAPEGAPLPHPPASDASLAQFHGYDAVVVTWTAAEASALASLFSPGHPTATWYPYRHDVSAYIPLVTGHRAPFNDPAPDMARCYHTMGLYFPCRIGAAKVLLFKSGLHLAYDGPATPVKTLMQELATTVAPKLFITTGTGGGIGTGVSLGDVVIAGTVKFDCKTQFAHQPWAAAHYAPAKLPAAALAAMTPALTAINAGRIPGARPAPKFFTGAAAAIVTTDFFAFDDSTDHYELQGLGQACDMGDAMVAQALQEFPDIAWYAVRNASDPQIPNPTDKITAAAEQAAMIYARYGGLTTAASLIATWAIIHTAIHAANTNHQTAKTKKGD